MFSPLGHVTTFDESRYTLRKAHFRPNSKSQQGLLLHTLFFLHRHLALSLSNSISLSLSLWIFSSLRFLLLIGVYLLLFLFLKTFPRRIDVNMCCFLSLTFFCDNLYFLNWFDFLFDHCIELLYTILQSLICFSDFIFSVINFDLFVSIFVVHFWISILWSFGYLSFRFMSSISSDYI